MNISKIVQNAKCLVLGATVATLGLSAFAAEPEAVQLWEGGPYFATCNIGANAPQEYGYYFWWGDTVGYTNNGSAWVSVADGTTTIEFSGTDPTATNTYKRTNAELKSLDYIDDDANPVLNATHDAAKMKLGDSWRMMTKVELDALTNTAYCTSAWTDNWNNTGVKGYIVTGNTSGYTDKSIFLPATGYGNGAKITNPSVVGCYWSSTPDLDNSNPELRLQYALNISFMSGAFRASGLPRYRGGVVRAVRDTPLVTGPTVKVDSVETGDPWSTITVNYTLGGTDATLDYKVAFDITAGGQTASVTNDAAKVMDGAATKVIDTAQLFGKQLADANAKVKVSLIAIRTKDLEGAQLGAGDVAEEEVVAFGEGGFWLGPDEIVVASGEKDFALTAFRELPKNPTEGDIRAAIEASGAKDSNRILALINGASDSVAVYRAFVAWAQGVGDVAVLDSDHAVDSFAFGVEELFENEPEVQISDVAVGTGVPGAMDIAVMVKDGDSPKRVSSEKVAQMFEATTDVADWTKGRIEVSVTDRTGKVATPVEFTVTPGDGTAEKAFLRIRK